jgi:hypothetical protein
MLEDIANQMAANADILYSQLLVLYCPDTADVALARIVSAPEVVTRVSMKSTGYPDPKSDYLCVQLSWISAKQWISGIHAAQIDQYVQRNGGRRGEPTAVRWVELSQMRAG